MFKLEPRPAPSKLLTFASPLIALAITVIVGVILFASLGKDPLAGLQVFFVEPLKSGYALSELSLKATPLVLIALGLSVCFRANLWNIGAEAQLYAGAAITAVLGTGLLPLPQPTITSKAMCTMFTLGQSARSKLLSPRTSAAGSPKASTDKTLGSVTAWCTRPSAESTTPSFPCE